MSPSLSKKGIFGIPAIHFGLAALSGLLLTASFPKVDWDFLAWIALVPLFFAIRGQSPGRAFKLGFFAGLVHYGTLVYWVVGVMQTYGGLPAPLSWAVLFLLTAYLSLYPAAFGSLMSPLMTGSCAAIWTAPFVWVSLEYVRGFLLSGFPWELLGYSQHNSLRLIQISDMFGVYGVSALIVVVNAASFAALDTVRRKRGFAWKPVLGAAACFIIALAYGSWRVSEIDRIARKASKRTVTIVQGNIDQSHKWLKSFQEETVRRYIGLTRKGLGVSPDLVVWPETALPFYFLHDQPMTDRVLDLVRQSGTYFVVGSPAFVQDNGTLLYYNSAYLIAPSADILGKYDKVHLVPYGEYVPLKRFFPFLGKLVEAVGDFESGKRGQVLSWNGEKLGPLICFEIIFPELARAMAANGARLLVTITNDAWFGRSSAPYQHLSMAVFRAVETRLAVARAANTGISAFIDPAGRLVEKTPLFEEDVRNRSLPLMTERTIYVRYGDIFAVGCFLIWFPAWFRALRNRRFRERSTPSRPNSGAK